jgi:glycosyltransferase involved in cell wall biosynthesis
MRAHNVGAKTVLDYPIARLDFTWSLLAEEARRRPLFADTIFSSQELTNRPEDLKRVASETDAADLVVVGSPFAAESFAGVVPPDRIAVVPYGVDTTSFTPASTAEGTTGKLRVLFAGQLTQRKGIAYVLEAMGELDPSRFELTLVGPVIGSGRGLGKYEGCFVHRSVRPKDMPQVYQSADVLVLPSIAEGSANVVLEAMACGLPVIVTPNAGANAVTDGIEGFVVPIRSPEAVASRLELLGSDHELRARMGNAARVRSTEFQWSDFRKSLRDVLPSNDREPTSSFARVVA